jgi:ketosteroid isomerase-like protein
VAQENAEIVRRCYECLNRGDIDEALVELADDFEMDWSNSIGPAKGVYRGKDEVRAIWASYLDAFEDVRWEVVDFKHMDEAMLIAATRFSARGRGSGVAVEGNGAQLWRFADGEALKVELHQGLPEAIKASGGDVEHDAM